jgi:hypothetical protein
MSCISSWVRSARVCAPHRRASDLKTQGSAANQVKITGKTREDCRIKNLIFDKKTYRGHGEDELVKGAARPCQPAL